jgi:hypothetical protein
MWVSDAERVENQEMPEAPKEAEQESGWALAEAYAHARIGEATPGELLAKAGEQAEGQPDREQVRLEGGRDQSSEEDERGQDRCGRERSAA